MATRNSVANNVSSTVPIHSSHLNSDSQSLARTQLAATINQSNIQHPNHNNHNLSHTGTKSNTSTTHPFLQSKFQIGSNRTTRTDFDLSERVFHRNDIPPKSRVAREEIQAFLHGSNIGGKKPWNFASVSGTNIRGLLGASWDSDSWDDRYYARIQSNYLIQKAQNRINLIRKGIDPDEDRQNIHSNRWNVSTKFYENSWVDENQMKLSSTTYKKKDIYSSTASLLTKMEQHKKQPNNYVNLTERETIYMEQERDRKRNNLESKQKLTQHEIETLQWKQAEQWAQHYEEEHQKLNIDYKQLQQDIEQQYNQDCLSNYLNQQESKTNTSNLNTISPRDNNTSAQNNNTNNNNKSRKKTIPLSVHASHHGRPIAETVITETSQLHSFSTKFGPELHPKPSLSATERIILKDKKLEKQSEFQPCPIYRHRGDWDIITTQWTCCNNTRQDSRGCEIEKFSENKRRIVIAKTDQRSKATGFEWSIHRPVMRNLINNNNDNNNNINNNNSRNNPQDSTAELSLSSSAKLSNMNNPHDSTLLNSTGFISPTYDPAATHLGPSGPGIAIIKRYEHEGVYGQLAGTGEKCWSCCLNEDENSLGCRNKTIVKENKWNIAEY